MRKIRVRVSCVRWRKMMTWHTLMDAYVFARIMTHVTIWLVNFKRWGLPHGMIWLSGV